VKGQKKEILARQKSIHANRTEVFYFLPTHNGTFAFAPIQETNASTKTKEPFFQTHTDKFIICLLSEK